MVGGVKSILLIMLSNILCSCSVSFIVIAHVSAAYSIVGIMHVSTSFQIVLISSWLKSLLPAMLNMVCSAACFFIWSSIDPLLFIVVPRYLYVVLSRLICHSLKGVSGCFPIVIV